MEKYFPKLIWAFCQKAWKKWKDFVKCMGKYLCSITNKEKKTERKKNCVYKST